MPRRNKARDKRYKQIVWLIAFVFVVLLTLQLKEVPYTASVEQDRQTLAQEVVAEQGFESFAVESLGFSFQFPRSQAPLVAASSEVGAVLSLTSRDLSLSFYEGPGFTLHPWTHYGSEDSCRYDGALHNFQSSQSIDCEFSTYTSGQEQILIKSLEKNDKTKHISVLPVQGRRHFLAISAIYTDDCNEKENVCAVRSEQTRQKVINFTNALLKKNHNLFTQ